MWEARKEFGCWDAARGGSAFDTFVFLCVRIPHTPLRIPATPTRGTRRPLPTRPLETVLSK